MIITARFTNLNDKYGKTDYEMRLRSRGHTKKIRFVVGQTKRIADNRRGANVNGVRARKDDGRI